MGELVLSLGNFYPPNMVYMIYTSALSPGLSLATKNSILPAISYKTFPDDLRVVLLRPAFSILAIQLLAFPIINILVAP